MRHHCIITGTGRAGTTFLVQLLTRLGFDTGFSPDNMPIDDVAHAGLEHDLRDAKAPYIVKSPWICNYIHELPTDVKIDVAIIPIRALSDAAESRRRVQRIRQTDLEVPGGLWEVSEPSDQEAELTRKFFHLIQHLVAMDIKMVFMDFPRIICDSSYLRQKLAEALTLPEAECFDRAFLETAKPELVHELTVAAELGSS